MIEAAHQSATDDELFSALIRNGKYWGKDEAVAFARSRYQANPELQLIEWANTLYGAIARAAVDGQHINVVRGFLALRPLIRPLIARGVHSQSIDEIIDITYTLWVWSYFARRIPFLNVDAAYWATEMLASKQIHKTSGYTNAMILLIYARWHLTAPDGDTANAPGYLALAFDELPRIHEPNHIGTVLKDLASLYWHIGEQKMARKYAAQLCNLEGLDPDVEKQAVFSVRHMFFP